LRARGSGTFKPYQGFTLHHTDRLKARTSERNDRLSGRRKKEATMAAIEPAGEKIVKNLQQAIERLQDDIARVELWAGALGCFTKPIPDYGHGQSRFDLPGSSDAAKDASKQDPHGPKQQRPRGLQ
jgi:hypothetical protein